MKLGCAMGSAFWEIESQGKREDDYLALIVRLARSLSLVRFCPIFPVNLREEKQNYFYILRFKFEEIFYVQ